MIGLCLQIKELKSRLAEENTTTSFEVKKEVTMAESEEDNDNPTFETSIPGLESKDHLDCNNDDVGLGAASLFFPLDMKDGSSDSDSSAILNEDNSPKAGILLSPESSPLKFNCFISSSPSSMNCFQYPKPYVKMEEHNFLSADEACNFFSDEQAPTLQWWS